MKYNLPLNSASDEKPLVLLDISVKTLMSTYASSNLPLISTASTL